MQRQDRVKAEVRDPSVRPRLCLLDAFEPGPAQPGDSAGPVAVVLSDGTVRRLSEAGRGGVPAAWTSGVLVGDGWTLWWERRRFATP